MTREKCVRKRADSYVAVYSFTRKRRRCCASLPPSVLYHIFSTPVVCAAYQSNYSQTLSRIARVTFRAGRIPRRVGQP